MPQPVQQRQTVRFESFELDLRTGELQIKGRKLILQQQPLQILSVLLEHPGELVSREQLIKRLWPEGTFVDFDHSLNKAVTKLREALQDSAENPRLIETLSRRGYRFIGKPTSDPVRIESLAVLPLENLSRDPEQEYFADGMTEALITSLAKIRALQVVSRTTAMHYKTVDRPLREIAQELQVQWVVEGTVLRQNQRVRISTQLIDASLDKHVWAESYERDLRDVLALQSEVALAVANEVRVKLTPSEKLQLSSERAVDPEAHEAYLKGRFHWNKRNGEGLHKCIEYFQLAIQRDPTYAAAYAGLADSAGIMGWWCFVPPEQGCGRGKVAALKALSIDHTTAEAHASLGWNLLHYDFDFLGAEHEFKRALELSPQHTTAVEWHACSLAAMGHLDEAVAEIMRAAKLDPLSPVINTVSGMILWLARQYDEGIEMCSRALELTHDFGLARWARAMLLVQQGASERATAEIITLVNASGDVPLYVHMLGHCYASAGKRADALQILHQLQSMSKERYISAYWPAVIHASLGENDEAFRWLDLAYKERSPWMVYTKVFPWLDCLRSDPRFDELVQRLNYPQSRQSH